MGFGIPQVITETKASGAQVIDGSVNLFSESNPCLEFTPGSDGNRSTWTISFWAKVDPKTTSTYNPIFISSSDNYNWEYEGLHYAGNNLYYIDYTSQSSGANILWRTNAKFRDTGWYHFMVVKVNNSTFKLYANGEELTDLSSSTNNGNQSSHWNKSGQKMFLGGAKYNTQFSSHCPGMSQFYFIDGQALAPTDFAFTDPLTNTWRPKKYTGTFTGTNTCYLPFDGNSPIGQDKSGNGNDWKPVNFGGSVALDNPIVSGARPILNTTPGGVSASVGVFGSKEGFTETVSSSSGGGNPYIFDTRGTQPTLSFIRGATYVFDYSSATSHPLRFATAADAAGSTQYTDGTSVSGNVISFTVPHNAPDTLYYYCTNHSGMGNSISVTTDTTKADPYAWKCTLALPLVGVANDVSNQINSGSTTKAMTAVGNAAASSDTSNFYGRSFEFDGSGDGITTPDNTDFEFGAGDFTIECWVKQDTTSSWRVFVAKYSGSGNGGFFMGQEASGKPVFINSDGTTFTATNVTANNQEWYHMAVCREGSATNLYINGVCEATGNTSNDSGSSSKLTIGFENDQSSSPFDGYLQDVRIYKGVAKYSGTTVGTQYFVVPSTNPSVLPDTPSGVSGSSKLAKITDGAVSFDGTGDYLIISDNADFEMGAGDFTIEAFFYNQENAVQSMITKYGDTVSTRSFWLGTLSSTNPSFYWYSGGSSYYINGGTGTLPLNKWSHVVAQRTSGDIYLFVDGKVVASATGASGAYSFNDTSEPLVIGSDSYASNEQPFQGFISNVRIVKGTGVYNTTGFTPPTAPLTNVTNTKLLCCQSNTEPGRAAVSPSISGLNNGTIWSDYLTTTQGLNSRDFYTAYNYPATNLFDGDTSSIVYGGWIDDSDDNSDLIFTPPSGITVSSKLEVYVGYYSLIKVNGSNYNTGGHNTGQAWVTVSDGSNFTGTLNELILENTTNANVVRAAAIRIDDSTILLDPVSVKGNSTAYNFNAFTTDINTVRGQESGYATWNPLSVRDNVTFSDGNLTLTNSGSGSSGWRNVACTQSVTSGKWYVEMLTVGSQNGGLFLGVCELPYDQGTFNPGSFSNNFPGMTANSYSLNCYSGAKRTNGSDSSYGSGMAVGDLIMMCLDLDNGAIWWGKNGIWFNGGNPSTNLNAAFTGLLGEFVFACGISANEKIVTNFGQKPFKFSPPDGFQPLNFANTRPVKVIARPDQYVKVTTYPGNTDTSRQIISGMQPDLVWLKNRDDATVHGIYDSVRGIQKRLSSDGNGQEQTDNGVLSFNSNGFNVGQVGLSNENGFDYVAWSWKAGGDKNTFNVDDVGYASASNVNMNTGALNSVAFDQSATWSNSLTASNGFISGSYDATKAFNGSTSGNHSGTNSGGTLTFSPNLTIPANSIIEVYSGSAESAYMDITVNGVANNSTPGGRFVKVSYDGSTTLTSLTVYRTGGGNSADLRGIRINGKLLVDSGVTVNAPSIAPAGCSVGTKQGFSIIRYQANSTAGASIPHGLSQAPNFVLVKALEIDGSSNSDWTVFHSSLGGTKAVYLNQQNAAGSTGSWNDTEPNAHVITLGTAHVSNLSPNDYIAYAWHDVPGLQKFGKYVGNGTADGPFVEVGFRPAIIWVKNTSSGSTNWVVFSEVIDDINPAYKRLQQNSTSTENTDTTTNATFDILSNGFKSRGGDGTFVNTSGNNYIYCAWAEAPSTNLYGAQSNAR
tara:strand:+ start:4824 stop:9935 length:5112 start_codon:yes stop_codon:yes gene_type:complete